MSVDINKLNKRELLLLNEQIVARLQYLDGIELSPVKDFSIGDSVCFEPVTGKVLNANVLKLSDKTASVLTDDGEKWNVALAFLSKTTSSEAGSSHPGKVLNFPPHS